jgi:hypothetical protein
LDRNKNRSKGRYDWDAVKLKLQHHLRLCFPNAKFIQNVDDNTLSESSFLVVTHPTAAFLATINRICKKAVIVLLANYGCEAPTLPSKTPLAIIDVLIDKPLLIKTEFTTLPKTSVKASLYIPDAPTDSQTNKMKFLSQLAIEKECSIGSIIALEELYVLSKFAQSDEISTICFPSLERK